MSLHDVSDELCLRLMGGMPPPVTNPAAEGRYYAVLRAKLVDAVGEEATEFSELCGGGLWFDLSQRVAFRESARSRS